MWFLITTLELFKAEARISSSDNAEPVGVVVGSGGPEGSLAWVARRARSALRAERVSWRVDFLEWTAFKRGLISDDFVFAAAFSEVSVDSELLEDDCCDAGGGFDGFLIGDS